jgi:hypothetical protein
MHVVLVIILALGTFWFFPRLAQALVALALLGGLIVAGVVVYQIIDHKQAPDAASVLAKVPTPAATLAQEPSVDDLIRAVDGDTPPAPCQTGRELVLEVFGGIPDPAPAWVRFALAQEGADLRRCGRTARP